TDQEFDTKELIGTVDENDLKQVAGAGDVNPETTPATPTIVAVSVKLCPTGVCTKSC
ncbi:class II lanthipeptide, LchA2/BrtA2 family, partial [Bacillus thuringiensis]|uniref:class II lanthipeptide, LchA2/BrtA2 family n=1 Tax=Bacillus thuringiensis TaxID=1428 RepID=UPI00366AB1EF